MNKKNKVLFYFKEDKRLAIKKINKSIEHWLKNKKKKFFLIITQTNLHYIGNHPIYIQIILISFSFGQMKKSKY